MGYFLKIVTLSLIFHYVESKALNKELNLKKSFQFELLPFKHFSFLIENLTPFGKFEMKHSLEKRETLDDIPIANAIPAVEEKKETVVITNAVAHAVESPVNPIPVPKADVIPFVIELAPKPVGAPVPVPLEPPIIARPQPPPPPVPVQTPNIPVFYTDISQIPYYNFAYPQPVPVELPIKPEVVVAPLVAPAAPVQPVNAPVPLEPVPVQPVPVAEVPLKPVTVVQEVVVKPVVSEVPPPPLVETPAVVPPQLPNYIVKGSRLIIFFGSKILQMLTQFIDGRSFNEFSLPPLPPTPLRKKK